MLTRDNSHVTAIETGVSFGPTATSENRASVPSRTTSSNSGFTPIIAALGLLAPAGTPPAIVSRLQQETAKALKKPAVQERLLALGAIPSGNTPAEFAQLIDAEIKKWAEVVKAAGARVD